MQTPAYQARNIGYSASVALYLHVGQETFQPTHVSDREIIFATPTELPAGLAVVEVVVDGVASTRTVQILPHPIGTTRFPIAGRSLSQISEHAST